MSASIYRIAGIALAIVIGAAYYFIPATEGGFHPKCLFYMVTGLYCPGCGSQRAWSALIHGHVGQAANLNLLLLVSLPFVLHSGFVHVWNAFSKKKIYQRWANSPFFAKAVLIVVMLFAVTRNLPFSPFKWLAP